MSVISPARPDLAAHREATTAPFPKLVRELVAVIGKKLTAYIAGVKDVRAIDRWMDEGAPYKSAERTVAICLPSGEDPENHEDGSVVQSWLTGLNPELNDRVPIRPVTEGDLEIVALRFWALSAHSWPEDSPFHSALNRRARYSAGHFHARLNGIEARPAAERNRIPRRN